MKELLTGISQQPDFPIDDLTEDNAALLEFMMANIQITQSGHDAAESASYVFKVGHSASMSSAARIYEDSSHHVAINHGISAFESMVALVGGMSTVSDMRPVHTTAGTLLHMRAYDVADYCDSAVDALKSQTPRVAEVIALSSRRFHGPLVSYAILGAVLPRQFELDCFEKAS